jgi:hypothetical protein
MAGILDGTELRHFHSGLAGGTGCTGHSGRYRNGIDNYGREGFGFGAFVEVKHLFFTALEAKKWRRKKVTGVIRRVTGRVIGRWIRRGWRVRSVQRAGARSEVRGFVTGASDHTPRRAAQREGLIERGGASSHMRPNASGRQNRSLDPNWTLTGRRV